MAPLCEFSWICGSGTGDKANRVFSFRSKRQRSATGIRGWSDVPTRPGQARVALWWHFLQHLCKSTHNLVHAHSHLNINAGFLLIRVDGPSILRNCAYPRDTWNFKPLSNVWKLQKTFETACFLSLGAFWILIYLPHSLLGCMCPHILAASPAVIILLLTQRPPYSRSPILQSIPMFCWGICHLTVAPISIQSSIFYSHLSCAMHNSEDNPATCHFICLQAPWR